MLCDWSLALRQVVVGESLRRFPTARTLRIKDGGFQEIQQHRNQDTVVSSGTNKAGKGRLYIQNERRTEHDTYTHTYTYICISELTTTQTRAQTRADLQCRWVNDKISIQMAGGSMAATFRRSRGLGSGWIGSEPPHIRMVLLAFWKESG